MQWIWSANQWLSLCNMIMLGWFLRSVLFYLVFILSCYSISYLSFLCVLDHLCLLKHYIYIYITYVYIYMYMYIYTSFHIYAKWRVSTYVFHKFSNVILYLGYICVTYTKSSISSIQNFYSSKGISYCFRYYYAITNRTIPHYVKHIKLKLHM